MPRGPEEDLRDAAPGPSTVGSSRARGEPTAARPAAPNHRRGGPSRAGRGAPERRWQRPAALPQGAVGGTRGGRGRLVPGGGRPSGGPGGAGSTGPEGRAVERGPGQGGVDRARREGGRAGERAVERGPGQGGVDRHAGGGRSGGPGGGRAPSRRGRSRAARRRVRSPRMPSSPPERPLDRGVVERARPATGPDCAAGPRAPECAAILVLSARLTGARPTARPAPRPSAVRGPDCAVSALPPGRPRPGRARVRTP
jgi:hypothetical protein